MKYFKLILLILLIAKFTYAGVQSIDKGIQFFYENPSATSVAVAGSFNDWNTNSDMMELDEKGIWTKTLPLKEGSYPYKFFVDGNHWVTDPDNPKTESDGYGGYNSVVSVNAEGKIDIDNQFSKQNVQRPGIPTSLNPKILLSGRYYSKANFINNDNQRYMLEKPVHDINLGLNMNLNNFVKAYTVMNINNIDEGTDMWKTHLNFKRSKLELNADIFYLTAFDNFGITTFNDPLHIVGDIGRYHYNFGYNNLGILAVSKIPTIKCPFTDSKVQFELKLLYADQSGDDDGDTKAIRSKIDFNINDDNNLFLGGTNYVVQIPVTSNSSQKHISNEVDLIFTHAIKSSNSEKPLLLNIESEYYSFENKDIDSLTTKWLDGNRIYAGIKLKFPETLKLYGQYQRNYLHFDGKLSKNQFTIGGDFQINELKAKAEMIYWQNEFPHNNNVSWNDYFRYMEKTDGNGRWFQQYSDVNFYKYTVLGYDTGLIWRINLCYNFNYKAYNFNLQYKNSISQIDFFYDPRFVENEFIITLNLSKHWSIYSNTRIPYYNDPFLGLKTDFSANKDLFIDNFTKVSYIINKNIQLSLGWGVNPRVLNSVTDKFYIGGRDEFLEEAGDLENYLENNYKGLGEQLRKAEEDLMEEQRIGVEAIVKF